MAGWTGSPTALPWRRLSDEGTDPGDGDGLEVHPTAVLYWGAGGRSFSSAENYSKGISVATRLPSGPSGHSAPSRIHW